MLKICLTGKGYSEEHFSKLQFKQLEITHITEHLTPSDLQKLLPKFDAYVLC